ncbi:hypothetical protein FRC03_001221 [Tulasnella sp. 419]|nr:hypothetical protein FRC03_001221 [Tulasnella sp. 419]
MSDVEEYEKLLKEIVGAKRVSQSKIQSITSLALKNMENDTKLISILYRTHKTLPATSKVSSLYVFDALARAARNHATKTKADQKAVTGNSATFLSKMEGVLDGLIRDMVLCGAPEAKEKTRKVLDIWSKANTFPKEVISRLVGITESGGGVENSADANQSSTTTQTHNVEPSNRDSTATSGHRTVDPRKPAAATATPAALPANLLALLGNQQASSSVSSNGGETSIAHQTVQASTPNSAQVVDPRLPSSVPVPPTASLDVAQLALLQQLAAGLSNANIQSANNSPVTSGPPLSNQPSEPNSFFPYESGRRSSEPSYASGRPYQDRDNYRRDYRADDDRRGGYRGGRGGRGGPYDTSYHQDRDMRGGGRWTEGPNSPGSWDRTRDRDYDRRRSRSPPPRGGYYNRRGTDYRRDHNSRPLSPSRRDQYTDPADSRGDTPSGPLVDEFGRELRNPMSPAQDQFVETTVQVSTEATPTNHKTLSRERSLSETIPPSSPAPRKRSRWGELPPNAVNGNQALSGQTSQDVSSIEKGPSQAQTLSSIPSLGDSDDTSNSSAGLGLDKFDLSTFDFTSPESWERLGNAWEVSYGRKPLPEEAMAFVTGQSMGGMTGWGVSGDTNMQGSDWNGGYGQGGRGGWRGGRGGRGRGRGRGREGWQTGGKRGYNDHMEDDGGSTEAVVLGEGGNTGAGGSKSQYSEGNQSYDGYWDGDQNGYGDTSGYEDNMGKAAGANDYSHYGHGYGDWNGNDGAYNSSSKVLGEQTGAAQGGGGDDGSKVDSAMDEGQPKSSGGKMIRVGDRWQWVKS